MNRKTLGIIFLLFGTVLFVGGLMAGVSSFLGMMNGLDPIAEFKSPGETELEITELGTHTLWLDHQYTAGGSVENYGTTLPPDFSFVLEPIDSSGTSPTPFTPLSVGSTQTLSTNTRQSIGLGTFDVKSTGKYRLSGSNPAAEPFRFSLTQGAFLTHLGGFISNAFIWGILAFVGLVLAVIGIVMMILGRKKSPPPALTIQ